MHSTRHTSHKRYNLPKMHYMCSAPKLQCTKYEPNRALSSQGFSYTEIQPFGATGATYGQKCLFYGIFGPFLTPLEAPGAISVGPNGPNRPSWMYPTQIQPRSTEIQPFGATGATYGHKCAFYGIFGPLLTRVVSWDILACLEMPNARFMALLCHFWPP